MISGGRPDHAGYIELYAPGVIADGSCLLVASLATSDAQAGALVVGLYPEGMIGLSLGFQPREHAHITTRPEGA